MRERGGEKFESVTESVTCVLVRVSHVRWRVLGILTVEVHCNGVIDLCVEGVRVVCGG